MAIIIGGIIVIIILITMAVAQAPTSNGQTIVGRYTAREIARRAGYSEQEAAMPSAELAMREMHGERAMRLACVRNAPTENKLQSAGAALLSYIDKVKLVEGSAITAQADRFRKETEKRIRFEQRAWYRQAAARAEKVSDIWGVIGALENVIKLCGSDDSAEEGEAQEAITAIQRGKEESFYAD